MKKKKKISDSKPSFCAYLRINLFNTFYLVFIFLWTIIAKNFRLLSYLVSLFLAPATPVALVFAHFSRNSFYRISVMFEKMLLLILTHRMSTSQHFTRRTNFLPCYQ